MPFHDLAAKELVTLPLILLMALPPPGFQPVDSTLVADAGSQTSDPTFYMHRTTPQTPAPSPTGLRMNTTAPPSAQSEVEFTLSRGGSAYWWSDLLSLGSVAGGTWTLYIWAYTHADQSKLDVYLDLTDNVGGNVRSIGSNLGTLINNVGHPSCTLYTVTITGVGLTINANDRLRLRLFAQTGPTMDTHMHFRYDGYGTCETSGNETRLFTALSLGGGFALNLRVRDWDMADNIQGATVYKDADFKTSDINGWANWTGVSGTVQIKVNYFGFWVNGTFSLTVTADTTIDIRTRLYDIAVTMKPDNLQGVLVGANVTVFNSTAYTPANKIRTGLTGANGQVILTNLPNNTLLFRSYGKADYSLVIAEFSETVSAEDQAFSQAASLNSGTTNLPWDLLIVTAGILPRCRRKQTCNKNPKEG